VQAWASSTAPTWAQAIAGERVAVRGVEYAPREHRRSLASASHRHHRARRHVGQAIAVECVAAPASSTAPTWAQGIAVEHIAVLASSTAVAVERAAISRAALADGWTHAFGATLRAARCRRCTSELEPAQRSHQLRQACLAHDSPHVFSASSVPASAIATPACRSAIATRRDRHRGRDRN
jgi:hypothetical protein